MSWLKGHLVLVFTGEFSGTNGQKLLNDLKHDQRAEVIIAKE
jgi:hypothetical protein